MTLKNPGESTKFVCDAVAQRYLANALAFIIRLILRNAIPDHIRPHHIFLQFIDFQGSDYSCN